MSEFITFLTGDYKLIQDDDKYLFSADSVLLANLASIGSDDKVADLGAGSGVISTLVAVKKGAKKVVAVEIDDATCDMAVRSVKLNHLEDKIEFVNADVKDVRSLFDSGSFNKVVCNPPYFYNNDGTSGMGSRAAARKEQEGALEDFVKGASYLLKNGGDLFVSYKFERLCDLMTTLRANGLEPKKIVLVYPKLSKGVDFVIVSAKKGGKTGLVSDTLILMDEENKYTPRVKELYK